MAGNNKCVVFAAYFCKSVLFASALTLLGCANSPEPLPADTRVGVAADLHSFAQPAALVADAPADMAREPQTASAMSDATPPKAFTTAPEREPERGGASWYGSGFHGKRTANGERYDMNALTAAHKTLPFGTMVRVKSLVNGREVLVRITDRGPFIRNRIIDLSRAAASELDMLGLGFKQVVLMVEGEATSKPVEEVRRRRRR